MSFDKYLEKIPDYQSFLTVDELDASTKRLAEQYPDTVEVFTAGYSTLGHPIYCLKIGNGTKNALAFGCPHPNEPIGAMMLESFSSLLAKNKDLRDELDFTWYIIKTSDPDGTKLNEGWFKGPYTLYNYARHYYRPAMNKQVEWTFPIKYKNLDFQSPIPETKVLMNLIEKIKPQFLYSLHNAGFGGVFWYISKEEPEIYQNLQAIAKKHGVPLSMGEPEAPYCRLLNPAVYNLINATDMYDFYEQQMGAEPEKLISCGTSSDDYANRFGETLTLVSELPYFYDPRIEDLTESDMIRRDAILKSCDFMEDSTKFLVEKYSLIEKDVSNDNPFKLALHDFIKFGTAEVQGKRQWANTAKELLAPAKVSEVFDSLYVSRFYNLLFLGLLVRMPEYENEQIIKEKSIDDCKLARLTEVLQEAEMRLKKQSAELEGQLNYSAIPIKKLISIQMESGFLAISVLNKKDGNRLKK